MRPNFWRAAWAIVLDLRAVADVGDDVDRLAAVRR